MILDGVIILFILFLLVMVQRKELLTKIKVLKDANSALGSDIMIIRHNVERNTSLLDAYTTALWDRIAMLEEYLNIEIQEPEKDCKYVKCKTK